jgi:hypothetical protein
MAKRDREEAGSRRRRKKGSKKTRCQSSQKIRKNRRIPTFNNCGGDSSYLGDSS